MAFFSPLWTVLFVSLEHDSSYFVSSEHDGIQSANPDYDDAVGTLRLVHEDVDWLLDMLASERSEGVDLSFSVAIRELTHRRSPSVPMPTVMPTVSLPSFSPPSP